MKYRRVPRRVRYLPEFQLTDAQWDSLAIPIQMAFFFHSTPATVHENQKHVRACPSCESTNG